jgi:hypothetical protein
MIKSHGSGSRGSNSPGATASRRRSATANMGALTGRKSTKSSVDTTPPGVVIDPRLPLTEVADAALSGAGFAPKDAGFGWRGENLLSMYDRTEPYLVTFGKTASYADVEERVGFDRSSPLRLMVNRGSKACDHTLLCTVHEALAYLASVNIVEFMRDHAPRGMVTLVCAGNVLEPEGGGVHHIPGLLVSEEEGGVHVHCMVVNYIRMARDAAIYPRVIRVYNEK